VAPFDLIGGLQSAFADLRRTPARVPTWTRVARPGAAATDGQLQSRQHYFEVRIDRAYLAYEREWFSRYAPVVLAAAEFSYDGAPLFAPTVVGPTSLKRLGGEVPVGATIANTRIAGPQPYSGEGLGVSLVLYRMELENIAQPFLDALEGAAAALDIAAGIVPYAKIAGVVLGGVSALVGGEKPLLARSDDFMPVQPGVFALIDAAAVDADSLEVHDGELYQGGEPFRTADYVLYSIRTVPQDEIDIARLALFRQWQAVLKESAKSGTKDVWESTKVNFSTLIGMLYTSPDLTRDHAAQLKSEWQDTIVARHKDAEQLATLADEVSPLDGVRSQALAVLDL
jgi:hypothetical protein